MNSDPRIWPKANQIIQQAELVCDHLFQIGVHDENAAAELAKLQRLLWEYRKLVPSVSDVVEIKALNQQLRREIRESRWKMLRSQLFRRTRVRENAKDPK